MRVWLLWHRQAHELDAVVSVHLTREGAESARAEKARKLNEEAAGLNLGPPFWTENGKADAEYGEYLELEEREALP